MKKEQVEHLFTLLCRNLLKEWWEEYQDMLPVPGGTMCGGISQGGLAALRYCASAARGRSRHHL